MITTKKIKSGQSGPIHVRIPSLLIIGMLLLSLPKTDQASPSVEVSGGYDIIILEGEMISEGDSVLWQNITVLISGNLTNRGSLDIKNSTIHFNGSRIRNLGYLNITDMDCDPETSSDGSLLMDISGNGSFIEGEGGLGVIVNRSEMHGIHLHGGPVRARDLRMFNSTFRTDTYSTFYDITMVGNGTSTAVRSGPGGGRFYDLNISSYDTALEIEKVLEYIRGISVSNCNRGLDLSWQGILDAATISDCYFKDNGVHIISRRNTDLLDCELHGPGKLVFSKERTTNILRNHFNGTNAVINATGGSVRENSFTSCTSVLEMPERSVITRNTFKSSGVVIRNDLNCTIFHNSFIENSRDAEGMVRSIWYNETSTEGNYYFEYRGKDDGSNGRRANDGIGDTNIPYIGRDLYPLMMDHYWDMPRIPELSTTYVEGSDSIRVDWEQGGANGFILQRSTSDDFSEMLRTWSLSEPGATIPDNPNTTVHFRARSFGPAGSRGWSLPVSVRVDQRPLPPMDIVAEPLEEGNALTIEWEWEGRDIEKALIYYGQKGQTPKLREAIYPTNELVIDGLKNGIEQEIRGQTIDGIGQHSRMSSSIFAAAMDTLPPPPPRNLVGDPTSNSSIMLNWNPPLIQDIGAYLLYRRDPGAQERRLIKNLSKNTYSYEDTGLLDNTTYHYSMASVDDDGPISDIGAEIAVKTDHYNQVPYFVGNEQIVYLVEDEGPGSLGLGGLFRDDDGDELEFYISDSYPFQANLIGDTLWITPEPDQSGEGYVEISVSDGEATSRYLIGVLVEPRPDAPRNVRILSPLNGSVLLPGAPVKLQGSGYDPDVNHGDVLEVTWTSDRQGILSRNSQGNLFAVVELDPGPHRITLTVEDRTGKTVSSNVSIILSLWGWGSIPWGISLGETMPLDGGLSTGLELLIENQSPFVMRFLIMGSLEDRGDLGERMVLIGPDTDGKVIIELPEGLEKREDIKINLRVEGETMNGTYAGSKDLVDTIRIEVADQGEDDDIWTPVIIVISTITMIGIAVYLLVVSRRKGTSDITKYD